MIRPMNISQFDVPLPAGSDGRTDEEDSRIQRENEQMVRDIRKLQASIE